MTQELTPSEGEKNSEMTPVSSDIETQDSASTVEETPEKEEVHPKLAKFLDSGEQSEKESGEVPTEPSKEQPEEKIASAQPSAQNTPQSDETPEETSEVPWKPSRLDERLAQLHVRYMALMGHVPPSAEEIYEKLREGDYQSKKESLHDHLRELKHLQAIDSEDPSREDMEALRDEEKESLRQEILKEEQEKRDAQKLEEEREFFVSFVNSHKELIKGSSEFDKDMYEAVNELFRGGMRIDKAFSTISKQFEKARNRAKKQEENQAVAGVFSGGESEGKKKSLSWDEVEQIRQTNPERYKQMVKKGELPE